MLKIEKTVTPSPEQWEIVIEGMRNPMNSWDKMDTCWTDNPGLLIGDAISYDGEGWWVLGKNDHNLMMRLNEGGSVHAKYRRMLPVWVTLTAPLYFFKEMDTYRIGVVCNSCSTMHKIHSRELTMDDFSCEHLYPENMIILQQTIDAINHAMNVYMNGGKPDYGSAKVDWWQLIQLLPSSYNQKRTYMFNYEVLAGMYRDRKHHKLDEWHVFCEWIESLPYSELITGREME